MADDEVRCVFGSGFFLSRFLCPYSLFKKINDREKTTACSSVKTRIGYFSNVTFSFSYCIFGGFSPLLIFYWTTETLKYRTHPIR